MALSHVERLIPGDEFEFLTPSGVISGKVLFVTTDIHEQILNVELESGLVDRVAPGRLTDGRINVPGLSISAYWKVRR